MLRILIALVLFCSSLEAMDVSRRVAVMGAGPAGLAAAQRLQEAGFIVKVYEIAPRVGGKCHTIKCSNGNDDLELGAIQVGVGYPRVTGYLKAVGMKLRNYWPARSLYYEENDGVYSAKYKTLSQDFWPLCEGGAIAREAHTMSAALDRFKGILESNFTEIPENSEFVQPFSAWADSLSLPHFKREYSIWMTAYGYGQLSNIPTYLAISLINSSYGLIAMRKANMNLRMIVGGYGGLLSKMVEHYNLDVRTNTRINNIERLPDRVRVTFESGHGEQGVEEFGYLVVASGMESIRSPFKENITPEEKYLANDVRYSPYDVVIAKVPMLEKGGYIMPQYFSTYGHVVMISKNLASSDEAILYIPRAGHARPRADTLAESIKRDLSVFGFKDIEILRIAYWDNYFPHFKTPSSYKVLNDIQGHNRTIYVGSVARFEIVERAMQDAWDKVDRYILDRPPVAQGGIKAMFESTKDYLSAQSKEK